MKVKSQSEMDYVLQGRMPNLQFTSYVRVQSAQLIISFRGLVPTDLYSKYSRGLIPDYHQNQKTPKCSRKGKEIVCNINPDKSLHVECVVLMSRVEKQNAQNAYKQRACRHWAILLAPLPQIIMSVSPSFLLFVGTYHLP